MLYNPGYHGASRPVTTAASVAPTFGDFYIFFLEKGVHGIRTPPNR
jgi:hypothetical protein